MARNNKQQGTLSGWVATNQPTTHRPTHMQEKVEMDWIGHRLRRRLGTSLARPGQVRSLSGSRIGNYGLDVPAECDMEEMV
ncbi:unnamed protein product [Heterobilharzia americana]|nr:unnamed protein product [Heterobilharzia americana]